MLRRKIEDQFRQWKEQKNHNPLVVKGPRQCGKTFSVLDFAEKNYESVVYINFFENPDYKDIFSGSLDIDRIIMLASALIPEKTDFIPNHTVIILDEIQECPEARTALKFFKMDGRFDVIATGSLLGVSGYGSKKNSAPRSVPVGYETIVDMYPLDFEEFLWAVGIGENIISVLAKCLEDEVPVAEVLHNRMRHLLLQYIVVGGMPAVVEQFCESKQMDTVLSMQRNIIREYEDDMVKYADEKDKTLIRECFESIPKQLARENKKFMYSAVKKGGTASRFAGILQWIEDAGIISRCYNLKIPELPLDGNADRDKFKVYMNDIGLLISMMEDGTQGDILRGNLYGYKGAIFENLIADFFVKMGRSLYYYHKDSGLEIDFVTRYYGECVLIEVKAVNGNAKSVQTILKHPEKYHVAGAIKLGDYNIGRNERLLTLPLYMGFLLKQR